MPSKMIGGMMMENLDHVAAHLAQSVNSRIAAECAGLGPITASAVARGIIDQAIGGEWDFLELKTYGQSYPEVVITQHRGAD